MKKKKMLKCIGGTLLGALTMGICLSAFPQAQTANAATLTGTVFEDEFSEKNLSNKWLKNDFCLDEQSYYSMRFNNQKDYGAAMLYRGYKIHDDCLISFDFYQSEVVPEAKRDNWFGVLLGYNDDSAHFTNGNAAILSYGRGQTQLMDDGDGTSEKLVADSYNDHSKFANSFNSTEGVLYTVELVISYTGVRYSDGENLYQVDGYYYEKSGVRSAIPKFTYKGVAAEGYFGFSSMSSSIMDVSNLQVFEGSERVVYENFKTENGSGKKLLPNTEQSDWKGINCSETKLYSYFNGRIDVSQASNGLALANYDLSADTLNKQTFDVTFGAEMVSLPANAAFGVALGLKDNSTSAQEGSFIGLKGISDEQFAFVHIVNGETVAQTNPLTKALISDGVFPISFTGYYDGSVEVRLAGYTASFENAAREGYLGVATQGEACGEVYFDNFNVSCSSYVSSTSANSAINFTGVKEVIEDDFVYPEKYVDERVWFLGSGVGFPKVYREGANYIQFTNSNERTFFGAKQTYSEFICRFSITVTQDRKDASGASLGLSFGKSSRNATVKNSPSIMFAMGEDGMLLQSYNATLVGANEQGVLKQYEMYPGLDFWSEEDWKSSPQTYRVMLIARGGKAYLYYANEDSMSEMNVCKAVLSDVETSGYVTVSALGGAGFRLNDFSVTNIAIDAKAETTTVGANETDTEYVNVNFANKSLYTAVGDVVELGKGISFGYNTEVKFHQNFTDFLAYVDIDSVAGEGILLKVGGQTIRLNSDGTVYSELKKIGGSGKFDFTSLKNGGVIMIEAIGKNLSVGIVGKGLPTDLLEDSIAVFEVENRVQAVEITVGTVGSTVMSLESVRAYTLQPTIAIEADNWETGDTELPEKKGPAGSETQSDEKQGCGSVVSLSGLLATMGVAVLGFYRKKESHNE